MTDLPSQRFAVQPVGYRLYLYPGIDLTEPAHKHCRLGLSDIRFTECDLALKVWQLDGVIIGYDQLTNARPGKIKRNRATQPAGTDNQHPALLQFQLPGNVQLGQQQLAAIAHQFIISQHWFAPPAF